MTTFKPIDIDEARRKRDNDEGKPRPKGTLPHLPDRDAPVSKLRDWLTNALKPPPGHRFETFERHGRGDDNGVVVVFRTPEGGRQSFRFEARMLNKPAMVRAAFYNITDAFCRPGHLTTSEAVDVWCGLCTVSTVLIEQDERDESHDWLEAFLGMCETEEQYSLTPAGKDDALVGLRARQKFDRRDAMAYLHEDRERQNDPNYRPTWLPPVLIIDSENGDHWIRQFELTTYVRYVVGLTITGPQLDGRMSEIGIGWRKFESNRPKAPHVRMKLYLLPESNGGNGAVEAK